MRSDEPRLSALASAIGEGVAIDWAGAESSAATPEERALIQQLRIVARVAQVHRRWGSLDLRQEIGHGTFGTVYRAWDARLAREVALKLIDEPAGPRTAVGSAIIEEGRLLARVRHPNVITIYGADVFGGRIGLSMEFIEGRTLKQLLLDHGPLGAREAMLIGIDLCRALAAVHQAGLVHGDLKAQNVMREAGGRIVLMDFGAGRDLLRAPHAGSPVAGTPLYLAPEICDGGAASAATDIYSLGVLLFYLVSGSFPVQGRTPDEVRGAHERGERALLRDVRSDLPSVFIQLVDRALAPDAAARFESAGAMERALEEALGVDRAQRRRTRTMQMLGGLLAVSVAIAAAVVGVTRASRAPASRAPSTVAAPPRNLVVLPCKTLGGNPSDQAYCDGLTDTLTAKLSRLTVGHALQMPPASEVRLRHVTNTDDARRTFGATMTLEGSVLRSGDTLRINYAMIDASTRLQLEALTLTARAADPFALQDKVAEWAIGTLSLTLSPPERAALAAHGTQVAGAYEFYLQGRGYLLDYQTPGHVDTAIELFDRALQLDSTYALAWAGLGRAAWQKYESTKEVALVDRAREACDRAVALDADLAAARICVGTVRLGTGHSAEAAADFQRALDAEPTSDEAYVGLARAQERLNDFAAAERTYKTAIALRPQYWASYGWLGSFYRNRARYDAAAEQFKIAVSLTPDNAQAYYALGGISTYLGRYDEATAAIRRSIDLAPTFAAYANLGMTYYRMRRFDEAVAMLERSRALSPDDYRVVGSLARAEYWAGRRRDAAVRYDRAVELVTQSLGINPSDKDALLSIAEFQAKRGRRADAADALRRAIGSAESDPHALLFAAMTECQLNDRDAALARLAQAVDRGLPEAELTAWIDLDGVRTDPRFQALFQRR